MPEMEAQITEVEVPDCEVKPGGVKYEVILEEAKTNDAPELRCPPAPSPSADDIESKLKAAEERRKSLEATALEKLAEKEKRAEEVRAKKASLASDDADEASAEASEASEAKPDGEE